MLRAPATDVHPPAGVLAVVSVAVAAAGLLTGSRAYRGRRDPALGSLGAVLEARWYVDALYDRAVVRPGRALARFLAGPVDLGAIDAAVNAVGETVARLGGAARALQTGYARQYALAVLVGTLVLLGAWMLR